MDIKDIFETSPITRGDLFYKLFSDLKDRDNDFILDLYETLLGDLDEEQVALIKQNELELASLFTALADQYEKEEEYKKAVLDPAYKEFNKYEFPIGIHGLGS
jgi:fructose-1-phosphate kinase PfkB-like protein